MLFHAIFQKLCILFFPGFYLIDTPAGILIQGNIVTAYQLRVSALDVKRVIFPIVFTGFRTIIPQMIYIIKPYLIFKVRLLHLFCRTGFDFRIKVHSVFVFYFQQPCHMVDTSDQFLPPSQLLFHIQRL